MESELKLTAVCAQWFWNSFPESRGMLVRVKNELDNHPYKKPEEKMKQLAENKATGIFAGPSDFYLILPQSIVIFIELKIEGGTQSKEQRAWEGKLLVRGHDYFIVYNFEEFKKLIYEQIKQR